MLTDALIAKLHFDNISQNRSLSLKRKDFYHLKKSIITNFPNSEHF